ncbi:MAG: hypothetical protein LC126_02620 [Bryobacterales bacterium]|nr:hypothetical protein [Bryobacterales bacterium]
MSHRLVLIVDECQYFVSSADVLFATTCASARGISVYASQSLELLFRMFFFFVTIVWNPYRHEGFSPYSPMRLNNHLEGAAQPSGALR